MRELEIQEIDAVSGAGYLSDLGESIGKAIGSIIDGGTALGGLNTDATSGAAQLGLGIGNLLELDFVNAISNIGNGIVAIVKFGIDAVSQSANKA